MVTRRLPQQPDRFSAGQRRRGQRGGTEVKRNQIIIVLGVVAVLALGAIAYFSTQTGGGNILAAATGGGLKVEVKPNDLLLGRPDAPVTILEFASMTCPHCAAFAIDVLPELKREYIDTGKVKLIFREYPLDGAARIASAAARCFVGEAAFNFVDLLFHNQQGPNAWIKDFDGDMQMTQQDIEEGMAVMGRMAGMGRDQIIACSRDPAKLAAVDANWTEGQTVYNVQATPTFIINGTLHRGELTFAALKTAIDPLLPN